MTVQHIQLSYVQKLTLVFLCCLTLMFTATTNAQDMSPNIAWEKINAGAMILDVRTEQEFAAGHIEGAINIPFEVVLAQLTKQNISKETQIVLYCRSGRRSGIANSALVDAGFTQTYNGGGLQMLEAQTSH
ncbi:rhodanese-like domain-containing protein [Shewanella olleyana]|uniref:rhodanese-like domain-containing protein n=1 Tax=Shewanella olleyana TaxID=135626 RepID=UPI00200FA73B|nr:rhodanese-like domain-containing protein [Shewanella olleyana]MCL1068649.1 rhodanese-like domain-containing protein [Shewanella olleyana]